MDTFIKILFYVCNPRYVYYQYFASYESYAIHVFDYSRRKYYRLLVRRDVLLLRKAAIEKVLAMSPVPENLTEENMVLLQTSLEKATFDITGVEEEIEFHVDMVKRSMTIITYFHYARELTAAQIKFP